MLLLVLPSNQVSYSLHRAQLGGTLTGGTKYCYRCGLLHVQDSVRPHPRHPRHELYRDLLSNVSSLPTHGTEVLGS